MKRKYTLEERYRFYGKKCDLLRHHLEFIKKELYKSEKRFRDITKRLYPDYMEKTSDEYQDWESQLERDLKDR
jgi:hypothetical protein